MFLPLLFSLFLETAQPSYATFMALLPEPVTLQASTLSLESPPTPVKKGDSLAPVIQAASVYSIDLASGAPLFSKNIFERRPIASISKLITAMVILDSHKLNEVVRVNRNATLQEPTKMYLRAGEEITVEALLTGLLVGSANDAAVALAEFAAGSEKAFVAKMNEKALQLGLMNSHFSNAKGFDETGNYSTAFDTMKFSQAAAGYPFIRKTTAIKKTTVTSANGKFTHTLENTNELLENPHFHIFGLKTGLTPGAGESFVSLAKGPGGREILTVVLGSPDRFQETKIVIDWVIRNWGF